MTTLCRPIAHRTVKQMAAFLSCLLALLPLIISGASAEQTTASIVDEGRLPLFEPVSSTTRGNNGNNGWLLLDPTNRVGYQVFRYTKEVSGTVLWAFDLDSLRPLRRELLVGFAVSEVGPNGARGDVIHAFDEPGRRLFLAGRRPQAFGFVDVAPEVLVIDERKFASGAPDFLTRTLVPTTDEAARLTARGLHGMTYESREGGGRLLLFAGDGTPGAQVYNHYLIAWDAGGGGESWVHRLASCQSGPFATSDTTVAQVPVLPTPRSLYVGCPGPSFSTVVARVNMADGAPTGDEVVSQLPRYSSNIYVDRAGRRLHFTAQLQGQTFWTFDAGSETFVGAAGTVLWDGFYSTSGLDQASGRLYALVPNHFRLDNGQVVRGGLLTTSGRLSPLPQFYNTRPDLEYTGEFQIKVDPLSKGGGRRVFLRRGNAVQPTTTKPDNTTVPRPTEEFFRVLRDRDDVPVGGRSDDADRNTAGVAEEPDVAEANYDATASGFGSRVMLIGGTNAAVSRDLDGLGTPVCFSNDRELIAGQSPGLVLSNVQAAASAAALTADPSTRADIDSPTARCSLDATPREAAKVVDSLVPAGIRPQWEEFGAQCSGDAGDRRAQVSSPPRLDASVSWRQDKRRVSAESLAQALPGTQQLGITVGSSWSAATLRHDPKFGVVSDVVSEARQIDIAGVGTIGYVKATASARAHGVAGSAKAAFTPLVCNVRFPKTDRFPGYEEPSCVKDTQDFVARFNQAFNGRARMRFRIPDASLLAGSPGGYQAAVQRDRYQALEDSAISRDGSSSVPALEIMVFRTDSRDRGPGRQIFQFAGVQVSASYGTYCLHGEEAPRKCRRAFPEDVSGIGDDDIDPLASSGPLAFAEAQQYDAVEQPSIDNRPSPSVLKRLLRVPAEALRLLFASPRQFGLMASVWALLWLPWYLADRRRAVAAQLASGGIAP